jgi:hypothetical protein
MNTHTLACGLVLATSLCRVPVQAQLIITQQPTNQSVSLGASAKFLVSARSANPPINYQWRFAGTNLVGQIASTLSLANIELTNAGDYDAVMTDGMGSITSRVAHLEVDPTFTKITTGPVVTSGGYGSACAWGDYDGDGFIDLFVCNFEDGINVPRNFLFHNRGDGTFERITSVPQVNGNHSTVGATWGDYDNDGKLDLFVTSIGGDANGQSYNALYHNEGGGHFTTITTGSLVTQKQRSHSGIWADFDNDGWLDIFIANFGNGTTNPALANIIYHNNGDGTFAPISFGAKVPFQGDSFDASAADFNNDGWLDLLVAQGAIYNPQASMLYSNKMDGTFMLVTNSAFSSLPGNSAACAFGDYDNDGFLDVFISNNAPNSDLQNFLYHNNGDGTFTLVTNSIVSLEPGSSAGCTWGDYDNDGWLDLFVARVGRYDSNFNIVALENNCLYHNKGDGTFEKVTSGSLVNEPGYSFGAAWGDYNNDGFLDLFVNNGFVATNANDFLFLSNTNQNNWVNFQLEGRASNRSAIGTKVRLKATIGGKTFWQMREISGGSGHGCQNDLRANFGLGDATNVDLVRIEWPSGIVQTMTNVAAKQFIKVLERQESASATSIGATAISFLAGGDVELATAGDLGLQYVFEGSTNLATWIKLGARTNLTGSAFFTDMKATNYAKRFYRVSVP